MYCEVKCSYILYLFVTFSSADFRTIKKQTNNPTMTIPPGQSPAKHPLPKPAGSESESPSKRPRLTQEGSAQLLSKPFKSPLKRVREAAPTPPSTPGVAGDSKDICNGSPPQTPSATSTTPCNPFKIPSRSTESDTTAATPVTAPISAPAPAPIPGATPTPTPTPARTKTKPTVKLPPDPRLATLQRQKRHLDTQNAGLATRIDSLDQAYRIEHRKQDAELSALIQRWREIARSAAEEIFGGAKVKVEAMGGMRAWKGQAEQKKSGQGSWGWEECAWESKEWGGGEEAVSEEEVEKERQLEKDALLEEVAGSDFDDDAVGGDGSAVATEAKDEVCDAMWCGCYGLLANYHSY